MNFPQKDLILKLLALGIFLAIQEITGDTVLETNPVTNWGPWGRFENCTGRGEFVQAFQLKTEPVGSGDNTALNGIKFYCGRSSGVHTEAITSTTGGWGDWGSIFSCGFGRGDMYGIQLNVEPYRGSGDDSATNNIRFFCSNDRDPVNDFLEGDGLSLGQWSPAEDILRCPPDEVLCGLQTQVEEYQGDDDDTALNNVRVKCCRVQI